MSLDRLEQELAAAATERPRDAARYTAALERAAHACRTDPVAADLFDLGELYHDLMAEYETLGRVEDALSIADAIVAAGLKTAPDSRCLRAEILMRAGRVAEAEPIWAAVRVDTPDDVWVYNNAGLEYGFAGDPATALEWLTGGLRLALRTGDPERLVGQLADLRQASLTKLGRSADALQQQATVFLSGTPPAHSIWASRTAPQPIREPDPGPVGLLALAWLPAGDYETALRIWPDFAGSDLMAGPDGPITHPRYCRAMQQRLVEYAQAGASALSVAPVRIAPFTAWCAEHGHDADSPDARAGYAARLARAGEVIAWPPGRNDPCWCGSGRKYKKCCAAPESNDPEPGR